MAFIGKCYAAGGQNDETESARRATWTGLQPAHVAAALAGLID